MPNDSHPADELAQVFHGLIDGDNFRQAVRGAWDRITAGATEPKESDVVQAMNKQMNDKAVQDANKTYLDASKAAQIRAKVSKSIGVK